LVARQFEVTPLAGSAIYNAIGQSYRATRHPDLRIVAELIRLIDLPPDETICDVGAGSGSYTNALATAGFQVFAVEPSEPMRVQATPHPRVAWYVGYAELIPLGDNAVSAIVCTLAAHHFTDLRAAAQEMHRVCPHGPLVFFTMDPRRGDDQWFSRYFPEIRQKDFEIFPALEDFASTVADATGRHADVTAFPLPPDLSDQFMYAPWAVPETYLNPQFRANTSGFATADRHVVRDQIAGLADDLASGRWEAEFGQYRTRQQNDAGFCFVRLRR
jgi:ubiquinone/menaquinone biosynthesis C-methylase UbiE